MTMACRTTPSRRAWYLVQSAGLVPLSPAGVHNLAPYSFFNGVATAPPMVMFASNGRQPHGAKDSLANVEETGEFVANLATWDLRDAMNRSSAPLGPDVDEFAFAGLEALPATLVRPARVAGAPVHLECVHHQTVDLPSTDPGGRNAIVIGQVVGVHIEDGLISDGILDLSRVQPLARLGYFDYTVVNEMFSISRPKAPQS